jgi:hypothetical protein
MMVDIPLTRPLPLKLPSFRSLDLTISAEWHTGWDLLMQDTVGERIAISFLSPLGSPGICDCLSLLSSLPLACGCIHLRLLG